MEEKSALEILRRVYTFIFSGLFLGSGALFLYLAFKNYLFSKGSESIKEANKMILYIVLGLIFLVSSTFVPNLVLNFLGGKAGSLPDIPIIRPTGTYTPYPLE